MNKERVKQCLTLSLSTSIWGVLGWDKNYFLPKIAKGFDKRSKVAIQSKLGSRFPSANVFYFKEALERYVPHGRGGKLRRSRTPQTKALPTPAKTFPPPLRRGAQATACGKMSADCKVGTVVFIPTSLGQDQVTLSECLVVCSNNQWSCGIARRYPVPSIRASPLAQWRTGAGYPSWPEHCVVSMQQTDDDKFVVKLRVLADVKPTHDANAVVPTLEDCYLDVFGERFSV